MSCSMQILQLNVLMIRDSDMSPCCTNCTGKDKNQDLLVIQELQFAYLSIFCSTLFLTVTKSQVSYSAVLDYAFIVFCRYHMNYSAYLYISSLNETWYWISPIIFCHMSSFMIVITEFCLEGVALLNQSSLVRSLLFRLVQSWNNCVSLPFVLGPQCTEQDTLHKLIFQIRNEQLKRHYVFH